MNASIQETSTKQSTDDASTLSPLMDPVYYCAIKMFIADVLQLQLMTNGIDTYFYCFVFDEMGLDVGVS